MAEVTYLRGAREMKWLPRAASQVFTKGQFVAISAAGYLTPATATSTEIVGIGLKTVTAADDDYATAVSHPYECPSEDTVYVVETSSAVQGDVGNFVDITDADTVNRGASALEVVRIERLISATEVEITIPKKSGVAQSAAAD